MVLRVVSLVLALPTSLFGADGAIPGYEGQIKTIISRGLEQYRNATSYADKLVIKIEVDAEGDESMQLPEEVHELALAWSRPNRIALVTNVYAVFCDGKRLWQHMKPLEQYVESAASERIDLAKLGLSEFPIYEQLKHPIASILGRGAVPPGEPFGEVTRFIGVKAEALAGKPGQRINGVVKFEAQQSPATTVPFDAWFSDETGLLEEIRYDHTDWIRKLIALGEGKVKLNKYLRRLRFEKIGLNEKIPSGEFVFKPGRYDEKKTRFRLLSEQEWQRKLIGRPAPDFNGTDIEGKPLGLSDFKGRVVLLDFWASWCGPCIITMPMIQTVADKFANKPVSIVGLNGDEPALKKRVIDILKRQKITYRQYMDVGNKAFMAYRVSLIPCVVLIGKKGTVQAVHADSTPGKDRILAQEIEKLLKGENLFVPAKPALGH